MNQSLFSRCLATAALIAIPLIAAVDDWPRWRGPADNGMAKGDAPIEWSETKNIAWKLAIPGRGFSSPVVWGDKIFLTTAVPSGTTNAEAPGASQERKGGKRGSGGPGGRGGGGGGMSGGAVGVEHKFVVMALDRKTGKTIWEQVAATSTPHEGHHPRYGSYASNSPVTDGKHLWVWFGSRGVYCYDLNGKLIWKKDDYKEAKMRLGFGEGTAAVISGDTLLLNFDMEQGSHFLALDKTTGKQLYRVERDEISGWSAPLVIDFQGQKQVVITATNKVRSYDLKTGKPIWECAGLGGNVIPAPVYADGIVYVMSGFRDPNLLAIKLGRTGDLTGTDAVLWTTNRGTSYTASPVLYDGRLYFVTDAGMVSCLDAKTGKPYYQQQRLPKPYSLKSSPVGVNGKLYIATENEDVVVLKMGEKFEVLSTNTLPDQSFISTPAVVEGTMYLRSETTLYAIKNK